MKKIMLPSFLLFTIIYGVIDGKDGFPERFENLPEFNKKQNFPSTVRKKCFDAELIGNIDRCWLGEEREKTRDNLDGMLIGDSFANHSASFIDVLAKDAGLFIHDSAAGGRPILTRLNGPNSYDYPTTYGDERLKYALQFEHIIVGVNWDFYANPNDINYEYLLNTIGTIVEANKKVTVIISLPATTKMNLHKLKLDKASPFVFFDSVDKTIPEPVIAETHIIKEMQRRYPHINYIDLKDVMCENQQCNILLNDSIVYRNANHFNTSGAAMMAEKYIKELGNPLKSVQLSNP